MALRIVRFMLALLIFMGLVPAKAQVMVIPEVQTNGVIMKHQLWSCMLQNSGNATLQVILMVTITDRQNNQVLSETSSPVIILPQGLKRVSFMDQSPLTFNTTSLGFAADRPMNNPLPVGDYQVCYRLIENNSKQQILAYECIRVESEALSPPQLILPEQGASLIDPRPALSWTPPAPVHLFTALEYGVRIVPLYHNQSPQEAMQRNIPVVTLQTRGNSMAFPASYSNLETGKTYAWQVGAFDAGRPGGESEVWTFTIMPDSVIQRIESAPFVRLEEEKKSTAIVHQRYLKLAYSHKGGDQTVDIVVRSVSQTGSKHGTYKQKLAVKTGENFFQVNLNGKMKLEVGQVYEVELINQSGKSMRLQFQTYNYF